MSFVCSFLHDDLAHYTTDKMAYIQKLHKFKVSSIGTCLKCAVFSQNVYTLP